jgi:transketolase
VSVWTRPFYFYVFCGSISPCDSIEAEKATIALAKLGAPAYLRLAREKTPIMTTKETPFEIGKAQVFYRPDGLGHVGIIATGALVHKALLAAKRLEKQGIRAVVLNLATIKPLDTTTILALAKETKALVTVEEHQIAGGMGSTVAEFLSETFPVPIKRIGVRDLFGQSGKPEELLTHYGMSVQDIEEAVKEVIEMRG